MSKIIKFIPKHDLAGTLAKPRPGKDYIPQWYKDAEIDAVPAPHENGGGGLKTCVPFLDALISGYVIETYKDIGVEKYRGSYRAYTLRHDGSKEFFVRLQDSNIIDERTSNSGHTIPRPAGHAQNHMVWSGWWGWKTPRGWSTLVTHPINRFDLPFTVVGGFMDSDKYYTPGNLPFFFKEDFEGVIPKGTPICQIFPVKRKNWFSVLDENLIPNMSKLADETGLVDRFYRDYKWVKKDYR